MARRERIESGEWASHPGMVDYRAEWFTDVLVERATWSSEAGLRYLSRELHQVVVAGPGYIWTRFWFRVEDQIVEKYFTAKGRPLGFYVPVCMPLEQHDRTLVAQPLGLALWIDPAGRVTVLGEPTFDEAAQEGNVTPVALEQAEQRIRELTTITAQRRFPPGFVRNFAIMTEENR